jgi:hypothetical protein
VGVRYLMYHRFVVEQYVGWLVALEVANKKFVAGQGCSMLKILLLGLLGVEVFFPPSIVIPPEVRWAECLSVPSMRQKSLF